MNLATLLKEAPALVRGGLPRIITSAPGRGKSDTVDRIYADVSRSEPDTWQFVRLFPATMTPADMMGYMVPAEVEGQLISQFTLPPWMVDVEGKPIDQSKKVFVFIDEYDKGEGDVKRVCAELFLHNRIGPHQLPKGSVVWAAANRAKDRSGSTKDYDFVINRRNEIPITDDLASWESWALSAGVEPEGVTFTKANPHVVFSEKAPEKQGPWCTPRSLVLCLQDLRAISGDGSLRTDAVASEIAAGWIGEGSVAQLFAQIKLGRDLPSYSEILDGPSTVRVPEQLDAQMLVAYQMAHRVKPAELDVVVTYVERLPKEFSITFAMAACKRDPSLVDTSTMGDWCVRNASLMSAIHEING